MKTKSHLRLVTSKPPPSRAAKLAPPRGLSKDARAFWEEMREGYSIVEPAGLCTLTLAAQALDQMARAQKVLDTTKDRYRVGRNGALHNHPAAKDFDMASRRYLQCLKAMKIKR